MTKMGRSMVKGAFLNRRTVLTHSLLILSLLAALLSVVWAPWTQSQAGASITVVRNSINGHFYEAVYVPEGITWDGRYASPSASIAGEVAAAPAAALPATVTSIEVVSTSIAGVVAAAPAAALLAAIEIGTTVAGEVAAVVAAPHTEKSIHLAGIEFDGYPSFVARQNGMAPDDVFLMICFDDYRIAHCTLHTSVRRSLEMITEDRVGQV
ncbi:MAG: 4-hydroxythreonine-4-phosphate dehydrogenase PdxA, partial [Chloroflexi bacterium]|nr:4-hydroxythreonine-4-phosphate dehydrogenase PdxA [Chloroflexota bacterium]